MTIAWDKTEIIFTWIPRKRKFTSKGWRKHVRRLKAQEVHEEDRAKDTR